MSRKVTFHRLARKELIEAAQYYESAGTGLGREFLREIDRCVQAITLNPHAGSVVIGGVRRWLAHAFPYAVVYAVKTSGIRVLAIMHLKRRPAYWVARR